MPQQSRYSNQEFEAAMQDIFDSLEKNNANRDLSLMVLGNVVSNIFVQQVPEGNREAMLNQFCDVLKRAVKGN
ncbi:MULTISPECIES: DUF1414 domain-containing protein [Alteromonadaceae]|jgi:uncharacterized protein YejL (UPF0352 family)|uniref:DUF1414 domain-containing protein n=1 Tax=Brumicola blandensis TaxID=3075611 RepID=A0AAW8QX53_9ALTE|nr:MULTISPECIES: DUF1414 domain-containing protein [unclassified Alteromonas]MDT0581666.1 DUF1414 domain-containing protein [Alteromonas sp. W409]MDT0627241.1 DUF1414 domain-containing protein [Alteromonas sp. W364]